MRKFETLEEVVEAVKYHNPQREFETVGDVLDELINFASSGKVCDHYNGPQALEDGLRSKFLQLSLPLSEIDCDVFGTAIKNIVENAGEIIFHYEQTLNDDDVDFFE